MATNSSILAWIIPWTEKPGRLHTAHGVAKSWTRLSDWAQHSRSNCVHLQTIWSCPPPALNSKCLINALCFLEKFQVCIKIDQKVQWVLIWLLCLHTHTHSFPFLSFSLVGYSPRGHRVRHNWATNAFTLSMHRQGGWQYKDHKEPHY